MRIKNNILLHYEFLAFECRAELSSAKLILTGSYKMDASLCDILKLQVENEFLQFEYNGEKYALELGEDANDWAEFITKNSN